MPDVVTLGECMAVLYPPEPVTLDDTTSLLLDIGGAEANLSIAVCRLGHSARFISRVGDDPFGQRMRATLAAEGVDVSALTIDPAAPTGVFFREWLPDGARRVYYYRAGSAASRIGPDDLRPELFAGARVVQDIADQGYGGRGYSCRDPEGHLWWFGSYDPWAAEA